MKKGSFISLILLLININPAWAIDIKISDTRENNFYIDALTFILDKSGKDYKITSVNLPTSSQQRKVLLIKKRVIDLMYAGTSIALEKELRPIRFPVMRGLAGRRIFLINKNYQAEYASIKNLNDLKQYTGVQGIGWSDKQVLEASGLKQVAKLYDDIFGNLNAGSRYYFPRGMTEIFAELENKKPKMENLIIEKSILLEYKTAVFFFVNPSNIALANTLNTGFINAYKEGSYNHFFYTHPLIIDSFKQAKLKTRKKIIVRNPFLSHETSDIPKQYWHQDNDSY